MSFRKLFIVLFISQTGLGPVAFADMDECIKNDVEFKAPDDDKTRAAMSGVWEKSGGDCDTFFKNWRKRDPGTEADYCPQCKEKMKHARGDEAIRDVRD